MVRVTWLVLMVSMLACSAVPGGGGAGGGEGGGDEEVGGGAETGGGTGGGGDDDALVPPPNARAVQVIAINATACARTEQKKLRCWGNNGSGSLENDPGAYQLFGKRMERRRYYTPVETLSDLEDFAMSYRHACGVFTGGKVKCWGEGWAGKLGNDNDLNSDDPVEVVGIANAKQVGVGTEFSCALLADGHIKCWGSDQYGQLMGQHDNPDGSAAAWKPVDMPGIGGDFVALQVSARGACGVKSNRTAVCWGSLFAPEPVTKDPTSGADPVTLTLANIDQLLVQYAGGYAIVGGALKSWGTSEGASLGNGTSNAFNEEREPVDVTGMSSGVTWATDAAAVKNGELWVWGLRPWLGVVLDDPRGSRVPVKVPGLTNVTRASVSWGDLSCALTGDGAVYCWGRHYWGQVGNGVNPMGDEVTYGTPQKVLSFP